MRQSEYGTWRRANRYTCWKAISQEFLRSLGARTLKLLRQVPTTSQLGCGTCKRSVALILPPSRGQLMLTTMQGKPYPNALLGHHNYIYSIAFSPKGNMLVSGSYDEAVFIWDVRAARIIRSLPAHSDPVGGVDFIRDGTLIASCASDGLM